MANEGVNDRWRKLSHIHHLAAIIIFFLNKEQRREKWEEEKREERRERREERGEKREERRERERREERGERKKRERRDKGERKERERKKRRKYDNDLLSIGRQKHTRMSRVKGHSGQPRGAAGEGRETLNNNLAFVAKR